MCNVTGYYPGPVTPSTADGAPKCEWWQISFTVSLKRGFWKVYSKGLHNCQLTPNNQELSMSCQYCHIIEKVVPKRRKTAFSSDWTNLQKTMIGQSSCCHRLAKSSNFSSSRNRLRLISKDSSLLLPAISGTWLKFPDSISAQESETFETVVWKVTGSISGGKAKTIGLNASNLSHL